MKPKRIWANLGVESIDRTQDFYLSIGFKLNGNPTEDLVSFLVGDDEFIIHFFKKERLKDSLEGEIADLNQGNEVMFSLSTESKDEFDSWINEVKKAGGTILFDSNIDRKAFYDENGYFVGVFADPDGHKFNLLYSDNM
ncbi:glyoxalase/bleomycin resistance/extradiol dioxygenase family protein [Echinicola jeungdonensis]|uniref:VOC family protein n=1 Tax=Echinicola jeungdonensis TaxID=709343 RepID=A0ABV5J3J4_9BACT|nr:VOC family protein [Echinicola jeungdonensis]MDN3668227.1 glyoxalase/bleomycin resistance/extradiol dioxygenase family protein [Echinicola jeungdonensis]